MKNITKILIISSILMMFIMPIMTFAQAEGSGSDTTPPPGLVQCGRKLAPIYSYKDKNGNYVPPPADPNNVPSDIIQTKIGMQVDRNNLCDFDKLIQLANNIIKFLLLLCLPIAAIMFAYAGVLLITSGGDTGARTKAKEVFLNAAIGLILAFAAYIIVMFILKTLGYDGSWIGFS